MTHPSCAISAGEATKQSAAVRLCQDAYGPTTQQPPAPPRAEHVRPHGQIDPRVPTLT